MKIEDILKVIEEHKSQMDGFGVGVISNDVEAADSLTQLQKTTTFAVDSKEDLEAARDSYDYGYYGKTLGLKLVLVGGKKVFKGKNGEARITDIKVLAVFDSID